jgi:mannose-6-phosphate isomerase
MPSIVKLDSPVLQYPWGSKTAFSRILGLANPGFRPQAELWMGAHPKAPSQALWDGAWVPLDRLIERHPREILGAAAERFDGKLPFLFKVLAAGEPLSIQAHPNRDQARRGFRREETQGIPRDGETRNYRDENHKPECLLALEPFEGLCGFREPARIRTLLGALAPRGLAPALEALETRETAAGLKAMLGRLLALNPERRRAALDEARGRLERVEGEVGECIARLFERFDPPPPGAQPDIGILAPAWLNLFRLKPGQAIFLPAGVMHAYLSGAGLEIMANSDNVVRGGLTTKHVDIPELLEILEFVAAPPRAIEPRAGLPGETLYPVPAEEFALSAIRVRADAGYSSRSDRRVEILLCTEGRCAFFQAAEDRPVLEIARGEACLVPAAAPAYRIKGDAVLYRATVGGGEWAATTSS